MHEMTGPLAGEFLSLTSTDTWVLVAFTLFVLLLAYVGAFKFIGGALDRRSAEIRRQLDEARQLREEAQRGLARIERQHQAVEQEAAQIVERAKSDAEAAAEAAKASIEASVAQKLASAEDQIRVAEESAVRTVREAAIDAAISASAELLGQRISGGDGETAIDRAIDDVRRVVAH